MGEEYPETTQTVAYEKAVEFQLNDIKDGFAETMCDFESGVSGEKIEITDRFGDIRMREKKGRFEKQDLQDNTVERRWLHKPTMDEAAVGLDPDDQHATEIPLDSPLAQSAARAVKINRSDRWLCGFYEPAAVGKEGNESVSFKSAHIIPADYGEDPGTFTGLTLAKLKRVNFLARRSFIDPTQAEKIHMGITAYEIEDLLSISEYIGRETNPDSQQQGLSSGAKQALQDGKPTPFMGIMFVPMEFDQEKAFPNVNDKALTTNGSGHRRCPLWLPSGMAGREWHIGMGRDRRVDLKGRPWQFTAENTIKFGRVHEDKCFIIETN